MTENELHDLIINDEMIKKGLSDILMNGFEGYNLKFIHEDTYINGITADFTFLCDDKINAIIECKGDNIGVTDYVRGIGQVFQYEYFFEQRLASKNYGYSENFSAVLIVPSSVFKDRSFNIGKFKYPKKIKLLEINNNNKIIREITKDELNKLGQSDGKDVISISQYYFRDNRIFEYYILLRYLAFLHYKGEKFVNRKNVENNFLVKINTPNKRNWRNAFITLSSLGLINSKNIPTPFGFTLAHKDYEDFAANILQSYMKPYVEELYSVLGSGSITYSHDTIRKAIVSKYSNKDISFLTDSGTRYISSWLNILRDDFGCIDFKPRRNERQIVYNPVELNTDTLIAKIKKHTRAYSYINDYKRLLG